MILDFLAGDILADDVTDDIIIGMNSQLQEVQGIGLPFTWQIQHNKPLKLGTVFSFELDAVRKLHMIICHHLGQGGWENSDQYLRFGMDYIRQTEGPRPCSMVKVGTGHIGQRDGADVPKIISAIADSHLAVTLYVYRPHEPEAVEARVALPLPSLVAYRAWNHEDGPLSLAA